MHLQKCPLSSLFGDLYSLIEEVLRVRLTALLTSRLTCRVTDIECIGTAKLILNIRYNLHLRIGISFDRDGHKLLTLILYLGLFLLYKVINKLRILDNLVVDLDARVITELCAIGCNGLTYVEIRHERLLFELCELS